MGKILLDVIPPMYNKFNMHYMKNIARYFNTVIGICNGKGRMSWMDISKLRIFLKVVDHKSMTKAAECLGYTQSGITHIINGIEHEIGVRLLKRDRSGVALTHEGTLVIPYFHNLVAVYEAMEQRIAEVNGLNHGIIRIGSFTSIALYYLPTILQRFMREHPMINITLMKGNSSDIEKCLDEGTIDIGFLSLQDYHKYDFIELIRDPICAVMSPDNPLSHYDPLPIDMLNDAPILRYVAPTGTDVDTAKVLASIHPKVVYTTNFDYSLINMARQNLGICILPNLIIDSDKNGVAVRHLLPECYRTVGMAVTSLDEISPATKAFVECTEYVMKNWEHISSE